MKTKILLGLFVCLPFFMPAQITLTTQLPNSGMLLKDQLWNIVITNNDYDIAELKLELDVRDVLLGQSVINATCGKIIIGKGMKLISINDVQPIMYNYMATEFSGNYLPCGNYTVHYHLVRLVSEGYIPVADEVVNINISPLSPPLLTMPLHKSGIEDVYPQFTWMPPAPMQMFNPLLYDITVVDIEEGQSGIEAIEFNKPVYINTNLRSPTEKMSGSYEQLQQGKSYAWQVVAKSGYSCAVVSEVWEFKINAPSEKKSLLEQTPFTKMKKENPDKGYAPGGILKASYINETTERSVVIEIIDPGKHHKDSPKFKVAVRPGENLIQYDLTKVLALEKGKIYEAQIVNERKEKWIVQFEVY